MQKKKEKLLEKIVKKNYNNELEEILEKKYFDESTKNILLNLLYKLEASYKDYEKVKRDAMPKEQFLQMVISIIKNNCDTFKIVKMNSEEAEILGKKTFLVDKKNKKIICYPIERKVLYCISKINKKDLIVKNKYHVLTKTISDLLNTGNNINSVEPLRDFNGFSWTTITREIESISHNLIYQNLRMIIGEKLLNNWIANKEFIIDYFELFTNNLEEKYGKKNSKQIIEIISKLSVLLELEYDEIQARKMQNEYKEVNEKLEKIKDREQFIKDVTMQKKELNKKIKKIDTIINDKKLLQKEYEERNELLPLDKKIFSMRILSNIMTKEREEVYIKLENINDMLNPQKFVQYKAELEEKNKYLKLTKVKNIEEEIKKLTLKLQKIFLDCYEIKVVNAKTKEEIINLLFEYRYYMMLPYDENKKIYQVKELEEKIEKITINLLDKAIKENVIAKFSKNRELEYKILKNIFYTRIIDLEDLYIKIIKENEKFYMQIFDENILEKKVELGNKEDINLKDMLIKLNKSIKVFN